jgi:uncharacterized protein YecT (DUF1311 family)
VALEGAAAEAQEVRQIAPQLFAPVYRDPNAPAHKPPPAPTSPPPAKPSPSAAASRPPAPAPIPSREKPFGICEPSANDFVVCLGAALSLADRAVDDAERAVLASLGGRPGVNPLIAETAARSLKAADDAWRILRDRECNDLPLIEAGLEGSIYERRLRCRLRRDIDRVEFLRVRYGPQG